MKLTDLYLGQLEREIVGTRSALERVPDGHNDWKPHPKSMPMGYLAALVARMPSWIAMVINQDEFNLNPQAGSPYTPKPQDASGELVRLLEESATEGRQALRDTNDEHLMKPWRFLVNGRLVSETPRHQVLSDTVFSHWSHHRGQLTVYLRLNDAAVPAIFGPSADEGFKFAS